MIPELATSHRWTLLGRIVRTAVWARPLLIVSSSSSSRRVAAKPAITRSASNRERSTTGPPGTGHGAAPVRKQLPP